MKRTTWLPLIAVWLSCAGAVWAASLGWFWLAILVAVLLSPLWLLWPLYLYAIKYEDDQHPERKVAYYATALIDIALNFTVLPLYVWSYPRGRAEITFTKHIARLRVTDRGWRGWFASWICRRMLDPYAPGGCHC